MPVFLVIFEAVKRKTASRHARMIPMPVFLVMMMPGRRTAETGVHILL